MKRFYCTICRKVRRVRRLPHNVTLTQGPRGPVYTEGTCTWHQFESHSEALRSDGRSSGLKTKFPAMTKTPTAPVATKKARGARA